MNCSCFDSLELLLFLIPKIIFFFAGNNPVPPTKVATLFKIDYDALYSVLCKKASGEATTLLLYFLIHRNHSFKSYLLNKIDIEQLVSYTHRPVSEIGQMCFSR